MQTYVRAPAPAPGLEAIPAAIGDSSGGRDGSSIEGVGVGVGVGLQNDYSSPIPTDGASVTPTKNPFLDRNRQGSGSVSGTQGP